jgi:Raf kinase inhibitor-like YbhB/YbcL family protein
MKITSKAFKHNGFIPKKYTCDGQNINPPLEFSNVPKSAKSLVLIVDDPDAPAKTWVHWLLWNISPDTKNIKEGNDEPQGAVSGITDFNKNGYGGPCPPSGNHRYFFKLYALNKKLNLNPKADKKKLLEKVKKYKIDSAELIGIYSRS